MLSLRASLIAILLAFASSALATSLLVLPAGTGPYPDLQAALTAAADGDTILLGDGVFMGAGNRNLDPGGRTLAFLSTSDDPEACIVDIAGSTSEERRFLADASGAGTTIAMRGIGLRNGRVTLGGGGAVLMNGGTLRITHCAFTDNASLYTAGPTGHGGAIAVENGDLVLAHATFSGNIAGNSFDGGAMGGAVYVSMGTAAIAACQFTDNEVGGSNLGPAMGGAVATYESSLDIDGCVFTGNDTHSYSAGGALALYGGSGSVRRCTFAYNWAFGFQDYGGTVFARDGALTLEACIITGAMGVDDFFGGDPEPTPAAEAYNATITASQCDVWGNGADWAGPLAGQDSANGNISANTCFCDGDAGDYGLCADSACAPAQHGGVLIGALEVGCGACGCADDTAVGDAPPDAPRIAAIAPNPFNPATTIALVLPAPATVRLTVHDLAGRCVATLVDGPQPAGERRIAFRPRGLASGAYLLRLDAGQDVRTRKLVLLK